MDKATKILSEVNEVIKLQQTTIERLDTLISKVDRFILGTKIISSTDCIETDLRSNELIEQLTEKLKHISFFQENLYNDLKKLETSYESRINYLESLLDNLFEDFYSFQNKASDTFFDASDLGEYMSDYGLTDLPELVKRLESRITHLEAYISLQAVENDSN